ncbi:MAG: hypothetical protein ABFS41_05325 [Myxococcota bacterium]
MAKLRERLEKLGREIGTREAEHGAALDAARDRAASLRVAVVEGLAGFREGAAAAGASHLDVEVSELRLDDKHVRSIEFDLWRGRYRAIVTVKSRGDVTLVGPFHAGKTEGPCQSFPFDAEDEIQAALADFLERFLTDAVTP